MILNQFSKFFSRILFASHPSLDVSHQKIVVNGNAFTTVTESLQNILTYMFTNSDINFLAYRTDLGRLTPEKDLSTFIDQMQRVSVQVSVEIAIPSLPKSINDCLSVQIQESQTSSRMATLGNRARRLQANVLQPLERLRNEIQFELTALQLQKVPWTDMVNQSLVHLKTTQVC